MEAHHYGNAPGLAAPASQDHHQPASLASSGAAHAGLTPTNERGPSTANAEAPEIAETQSSILEHHAEDGKRFNSLRAGLVLKGYSLSRTADKDGPVAFFVTRWGMARELRSLADVDRFLAQVGGAHG